MSKELKNTYKKERKMKSLRNKLLAAGAFGVILIAVIVFFMNISYENAEQRLRTDVEKQERNIEANLDKMIKTIAQQAQVTEKYAADFKEVALGMVQGRYGDNGSQAMFQWLKEHNLSIDADIYKKIMTTVEATRMSFEREQRTLSLMAAEHKKMYVTIPAKWFVEGEPVKIQIISSAKTKDIIKTGEENDIDVFK